MNIVTPYIPREYLALKINYCRQQLAALPEVVRTKRRIRGIKKDVYVYQNHAYMPDSKTGLLLQQSFQKRAEINSQLSRHMGVWKSVFVCIPPLDIEPRKIRRRYIDSIGEPVIGETLSHAGGGAEYREDLIGAMLHQGIKADFRMFLPKASLFVIHEGGEHTAVIHVVTVDDGVV